jgi:hypothetical protein
MRYPLVPLKDGVLEDVLAYWQATRGGRPMPARHELDITRMPTRCIPHLFLVDVMAEAPWFVYRLAGTRIEVEFGISLRGKSLHDLPFGTEEESVFGQYEEARATGQPTYCEHQFVNTKRYPVHYRRLLLPLSDRGERVDQLLGAAVFLRP